VNRLLEAQSSAAYFGIGKLRPEQIAQMSTWSAVPDDQNILAAMHIIHVAPAGRTTITTLNPTDPGTDAGPDRGWLARPGHNGRMFKTRRP